MYTAKVIEKVLQGAAMRFIVEFSNGETSVQESVIPQDEEGFKFWVKSRLAVFNAGETLALTYTEGSVIDVTEPEKPEKILTQAEIDHTQWLNDYNKWVKIKTTLIDTGILTGNETQVAALKTKVQNNFKPAYIATL